MKIGVIGYNGINLKQKYNFTKKENVTNNFKSTNISSVESSMIRINMLPKISFKGAGITLQKLKERELEINVDALNLYARTQTLYHYWGPHYADNAKEMYSMVIGDLENAENDDSVYISRGIEDGQMVPIRMNKVDGLKRRLYTADFVKGKIQQITFYDCGGKISDVIKFDSETGDLLSIQNQNGNLDGDYDALYEFKKDESGNITLAKYFEEFRQFEGAKGGILKKVVEFDGPSKLVSEDDVVVVGEARKINVGKHFEFEDDRNYEFMYDKEILPDGSMIYGTKGKVENFNLVNFDLGKSKFTDGTVIQRPRIVIDDGKIIEYDCGYSITEKGVLTRKNYIKNDNGIPQEILRLLGFI